MTDLQQNVHGRQNIVIGNANRATINISMVFSGSLDYQALVDEKKLYEELLSHLDPAELVLRIKTAEKLRTVQSKMENLKMEVMHLAASFESSNVSTDRFDKAETLFARGEFLLANEMLDIAQIDNDFRLAQEIIRSKEQEIEKITQKIQQLANELIVKGKLSELIVGTDAQDRMDAAEHYYLRAIEISPATEIKFAVALFYVRNEKPERAEEILKEIKAENKKLTIEWNCKVCRELGEIHLSRADDECLLYFTECIEACKKLILVNDDKKYTFWLADSYSNLGVYYSKNCNWQKSIAMITKAITIRMENELIDNNHNAFNQSLSLYNLGLIYFDRQNYDQTIEQLLKAVDSFNRIDNPSLHYLHHKKQLFRWLGRAHYKKFEREKAIEYFTQQIAVLTLLLPSYPNYIGEIAETEWFIGSKYCELAMVNEAFDYFKYCVAHVRIMHKAGLISSYKYLEQYLLDIADTLVYRSRLDLAKEFLEEACEIIGEQDNPDQFSWLQSRVNRLMEAVLQRL